MSGGINAIAWVLWFLAVAIVPLTSRNPLYLVLVLLVAVVVLFSLPQQQGQTSAWRLFAYIGSGVATLSIGFNVLTVHVGNQQFARLPDSLPIIGGPLTINALVYGAISATAIAAVLFGAAAFNSAVRHADLVRLLPGSLSRFGVAAGVALLFVPQTISASRDIYDAQRARGHHFRSLGDARAFIVPLLSTSLERALLLSEALETRGFGSSAIERQPDRRGLLANLGSAVSIVLALVTLGFGSYSLGILLMGFAVILAVVRSGNQIQRTRLRPIAWSTASLLVAAASATALLTLLFGRAVTDLYFTYDTFPAIETPQFSILAGAAIVLLVFPALVVER
jgi:energy-coupling factor transport system permease protein